MVAHPARRLFTVDEYYRMADAGIFGEDDRVELIKGEIVTMPPIGSPHAACVMRLNQILQTQVGDRATISIQGPLRLNNRSEPVPDVMLLAPRDDFYASGHPAPSDVHLLIEVSDTSLAYDSGIKLHLYARSLIGEVWIVDLHGQRIRAFREPTASGYRQSDVTLRDSTVSPVIFPDVHILVADVLG
jgi:Uma2 family endonuclease